MEDRYVRSKGGRRPQGPSETSVRLMYERRPLKSASLSPPDFQISSHILLESYVEKEVRFAGIMPNVPSFLDVTNRTDILKEIDRGKRQKKIPWRSSIDHDAIFSLCVHNIKISQRDGDELLLLRLPIDEIQSMCYIRDDSDHMLCIKFADPEYGASSNQQDTCHLAVLYCDSNLTAEELCSLMNQCFQLVYQEATIKFLDRVNVGEEPYDFSLASSTITRGGKRFPKSPQLDKNLGFLSQSSLDLDVNGGSSSNYNNTSTISSGTSRSFPRRSSNTTVRSESDTSTTNNSTVTATISENLLTDYMNKLFDKLNADELRRFAFLVKAWHSNMPFKEFCDKVLDLYGPERKYLLEGMRPFIPEKESQYFESFLERLGLKSAAHTTSGSLSTAQGTMSSGLTSKVYRRSFTSNGTSAGNQAGGFPVGDLLGAMGTGTGVPDDSDFDMQLNQITNNIQNLGSSVNLSDPEPDYLPKTT